MSPPLCHKHTSKHPLLYKVLKGHRPGLEEVLSYAAPIKPHTDTNKIWIRPISYDGNRPYYLIRGTSPIFDGKNGAWPFTLAKKRHSQKQTSFGHTQWNTTPKSRKYRFSYILAQWGETGSFFFNALVFSSRFLIFQEASWNFLHPFPKIRKARGRRGWTFSSEEEAFLIWINGNHLFALKIDME